MKYIRGVIEKINGCNVRVRYSQDIYNSKYNKRLSRFSHLIAHCDFPVEVKQEVSVVSCAPISKSKFFKVVKEKS